MVKKMSSHQRVLPNNQTNQTPSRYAPSTPHAIRALQQRSGARTRTARHKRVHSDPVQRESLGGVLRKFAKVSAATSKKIIATPGTAQGKENRIPQESDHERSGKRPRLGLDLSDSLEGIEQPSADEGEEDSEPLPAPTPSLLPDEHEPGPEKDEPTFTFKSIRSGFGRTYSESDRRNSRRPFPASDPTIFQEAGDDEEMTILSERGRRAPTQEPTEAFSHYDFSVANLDDSAFPQSVGRHEKTETGLPVFHDRDEPFADIGETEILGHVDDDDKSVQQSPLFEPEVASPVLKDFSFQLPEFSVEATSHQSRAQPDSRTVEASILDTDEPSEDISHPESRPGVEKDAQISARSEPRSSTSPQPPHDLSSAVPPRPRRKKLKMTRHGDLIPSLPSSFIKRVALEAQTRLGNRRPQFSKDHIKALEQATEWFFEQVGEDLAVYSEHARRKRRIDQRDALLLLRRQRILQGERELLDAVKEHLPTDAVSDLDLEDLSEA
jgi:histone H3/H4